MPCSVTKRCSIRWPPEAAYEDTLTLVISVANYFVDVRVKKDYSTLDWAFAGTKRVEDDGRNVWTHEIDSRNCLDEDSGYIEVLPNGDELEKGQMRNPDRDNRVMKHEEVWRNIPLLKAEGVIARQDDKTHWLAVVDNYLLLLDSMNGAFSVASYVKHNGTWQKIYKVGLRMYPEILADSNIHDLLKNSRWEIVANEGYGSF